MKRKFGDALVLLAVFFAVCLLPGACRKEKASETGGIKVTATWRSFSSAGSYAFSKGPASFRLLKESQVVDTITCKVLPSPENHDEQMSTIAFRNRHPYGKYKVIGSTLMLYRGGPNYSSDTIEGSADFILNADSARVQIRL